MSLRHQEPWRQAGNSSIVITQVIIMEIMYLTNLLESLADWIAILYISNVKWLILYFCICGKHFALFYTGDL